MGRHQRAETAGLLASVLCAVLAWSALTVYGQIANAIGMVSGQLYLFSSGVVASCAALSFVVGYARRSGSWTLERGWLRPIRRIIEIVALATVYTSTVFLCVFALLSVINGVVGVIMIRAYIAALGSGLAAVAGYMGYVQADNLNAKTIAALLPVFIIAGVSTAALSSDDPYWWKNNFSQLGDRTTFAARMFNTTIMMAGVCVIIVSYFAISELITTHRMWQLWRDMHTDEVAQLQESSSPHTMRDRMVAIDHFQVRITVLMILLVMVGVCFIGVGMFRYTPHQFLHNVFARGLSVPMGLLFIMLPWLVPQFSRSIYVVSDCIVAVIIVVWVRWQLHIDTLTNVEALACALFMGWFMVFSRQIAAMEADRIHVQLTSMHPMLAKADSRINPER